MKKYFLKEEGQNLKFRVYRKAPSSEFQDTLIASCGYPEHATLIIESLNSPKSKKVKALKPARFG